MIYPQVVEELNKFGYGLPAGKVLFVTALNSIQMSMVSGMTTLGVECEALTIDNYEEVLASDLKVIFTSPEVLKHPRVCRCMLSHRNAFILEVIDEAHLVVSWGLKGRDKAAFRPVMSLASGELSVIGGQMLLMTAKATSKSIRLLTDQLPEIRKWNMILNSPMREGVTIIVPPSEILSSKFEVSLEPFIERMKLLKETN